MSLWKETDPEKIYSYYNKRDECINLKISNKKSTKKDSSKLKEYHSYIDSELPSKIFSRKENYITKNELQQIMLYKLNRGTFRPKLLSYINSNTNESVIDITKQAFKIADSFTNYKESSINNNNNNKKHKKDNNKNNNNNNDNNNNKVIHFYKLSQLKNSINVLSKLKGVGCATASLILSIYNNKVPFMADESMKEIGMELKYTIKHYMIFAEKMHEKCMELNKNNNDNYGITPAMLSECLWVYNIMRKYKKIDESGIKKVGNIVKKRKRNKNDANPRPKQKRRKS